MPKLWIAALLASSISPTLTACNSSAGRQPSVQAVKGDLQTFPVRGRIVAVQGTSITLDHEAVPGFMDAMTMPYKLKDPSIVSELHPGDRITATILARKGADGFSDPMLDQIVVIAQARPDYKPAAQYHVPAPGDLVPNFALLNQSGRTIHVNQFRGKLLLATFVYTRCTLADFCPRMSRNFASIDGQLATDPKLYIGTHLLSISFDPAYDTPQVLRSYGGSYTGRFTKEDFKHWDFAAPPPAELPQVAQWFGVGITPGEAGSLSHSLSTALIGKDGRIVAWYPTNEWTTDQILAAIHKAAGTA